jgi:putative acetyltransferase
VCTFRRLYLDRSLRGAGTGTLLMRWAVEWALAHELTRVEFWSDSRFARAHRFFEKCGFIRTGEVRQMNDGAEPYAEYFFHGDLRNMAESKLLAE